MDDREYGAVVAIAKWVLRADSPVHSTRTIPPPAATGPGAATAAGLVGFAIGSETGGSIIGPSMRCGITGLRPTYGRVPRTGAMTLCWSLDKLGPMTRSVEDALLVLQVISGPDAGDVSSVSSRLDFDTGATVEGLREVKQSETAIMVHWKDSNHDPFSVLDLSPILEGSDAAQSFRNTVELAQ